jgi:hypothetical protein
VSQQINLFNPILLHRKKYFSALAMAQALALILIGALLVALYVNHRSSGLQAEAGKTSAQLGVALAQQARVNAEFGPHAPNPALAAELQKAGADVKALQRIFDLLQTGAIGDTSGYSEYLRAFSRQIADGLWLTGLTIQGAGNEIALQGRTLQPDLVPAYISRLTREPVMRGKSFSMLEMQQPQPEPGSGTEGGTPPKAAGYLEFRLQSAAAKDADSPAGAKRK